MYFSGSYSFKNPIDKVWNDLNNPKFLKQAIHGCQEFIEEGNNSYYLKLQVKLGPINAIFSGKLFIKDANPPFSYIIEAKGSAGQLGGASGTVHVTLNEVDDNTNLNYKANTKINGKIAQLGARLIEGAVKKNTVLFFNNFEKLSSISNDFNNEKSLKDEKVLESNKKLNSLKKKHYYAFFLIMIMIITFISYYE